MVKVEDLTVTYCAGPTPARSGPWRPRWIPRGPPSKSLVFLVFLRRRPWKSAGGHSPHDADVMLIVKKLCLSPNPYENRKNRGFRMVPGGPRPRGSSAGRTLGRRAGRVSPCRLDIKVERFIGTAAKRNPCLSHSVQK